MKSLSVILNLFLCQFIQSQTVEIVGKIESTSNLENIHVINKTAKKYAITYKDGVFKIPVNLNDTLSFSSVQHQFKEVIISKEIVASKRILVILDELVNVLDDVVIGKILTGNLVTDVKNTEVKQQITLNLTNIAAPKEYFDDKAFDKQQALNHYQYILNPNVRFYEPNFFNIAESILGVEVPKSVKLFNGKIKEEPTFLLKVYSRKAIFENFNIPLNRVDEFILFLEKEGFKSNLLKKENEHLLIEFLMIKSELFLSNDSKK